MFQFKIYVTTFILSFLISIQGFSQTGIAGIGTNTGTSNLRLWLNANSGVNLTGSNITSWADLSGYGNNAAPLATANRPTLLNNTVNSFPVVRFDGIDDYLQVGTTTSLNMTQWSIIIVTKVNTNKDYNYFFGKGNDSQENYELLAYNNPFMHTPIYYTDGTRDYPNTATLAAINTYAIWQYDYSSTGGRAVYLNGVAQLTDAASKTPQTNNFQAWIGNERGTSGRFLDGDIAEMAVFTTRQNDVQRIIIQNYLSAKYNIALGASDLFVGDNAGNGNYDFGGAGIGRSSTGNSQNSFSPSVSKGLGLSYVSGFDNGDYVMVGNNLKSGNTEQFTDVGGITGTLVSRWKRMWYLDVTNTGANMVTNVTFDMSDGGVNMLPTLASNYVLLYRAGQSGNWTEVSTANSISGDVVNFNNITLSNDGYYTIGSRDYLGSPLPITFINLNINSYEKGVIATWQVLQIGKAYKVSLLRSKDALNWEEVNSKQITYSNDLSDSLADATSDCVSIYYKLSCVEENGDISYSNVQMVKLNKSCYTSVELYPNPCVDYIVLKGGLVEDSQIRIFDMKGVPYNLNINNKSANYLELNTIGLTSGTYLLEIDNKKLAKSMVYRFVVQ